MCTNYVLIKSDGSAKLAEALGVDANRLICGDFRPGAQISVVTGGSEARLLRTATWWLYLKQTQEGLRPHKDYFSVNTNYRKLPQKSEFKHSRCIIPATAFVESQDGKSPHLLEPANGNAIAFGGLYKEWTDKVTGEVVTSASIITLPGIPALEQIHRKSTPLWLPEDAYDSWLSPEVTDVTALEGLLAPALRADLMATPIDKVSLKQPVGEPFLIQS